MTGPTYQTPMTEILATWTLGHGLGSTDAHRACTVSALNLALTGRLTDDRPDCLSPVIHSFVIPLQDAMPVARLNAPAWLALVPRLAGTYPASAAVERARRDLILDWMWARLADIRLTIPEGPARTAWDRMTTARTVTAAAAAAAAEWAAAEAGRAGGERDGYWDRAQPEALIAALIEVTL